MKILKYAIGTYTNKKCYNIIQIQTKIFISRVKIIQYAFFQFPKKKKIKSVLYIDTQ